MTDPRITTVLTPKVADQNAPLTRGEVALKIITTTQDLQTVRRPLRIDGVIGSIAKDGSSATIQTAKGDVTVQLRNNTPVKEGQNVQIDVPAGSPPRQTILRPAPETNAQPAQPQQPGTTPAPTTSGEAPAKAPVTPSSQPSSAQPLQPPAQTQAQPPASGNATQPTQPGPPPVATTTQAALAPEIRALLDQASPLPPAIPAAQRAAALPLNAIVRLVPLAGLPATADLLPVPAAIQALIDSASAKFDAFNPVTSKILLASDEFASPAGGGPFTTPGQTTPTLPGSPPKPGTALQAQIPASPFDAKLITILPDAGFKPPAPGPALTVPAVESPIGKQEPAKILADVIAMTRQNLPVVSLTLPGAKAPQLFMLQFPATNIEPGMRLEILPAPILPVAVPATPATPSSVSPDPLTGWTWPSLDDAVTILAQSMPQAQMARTLANVLPSPARTVEIPPAMQFFMAAIQSGDIASWFGDKAISALRRDTARGGDTLSRLTQDVDSLARGMDTPVQEWKGVAIPLLWQSEIQKIHLYYKHQDAEKEEDQEKGERTTRFIFDLNLTRLGDIQLDGLMKTSRLDLILRTGTMFSHGMQTALRQKYQSVLETGNLTGDLTFQNRMDQWVHVKVNARNPKLGASA